MRIHFRIKVILVYILVVAIFTSFFFVPDKHNKALFEEIHRSIFVLCLDKPVGGSEAEKHTTMANQVEATLQNHGLDDKKKTNKI